MAAFAQQDFSGDIVDTTNGNNTTKAKIYATKDKIRFEPQSEGRNNTAVIVNFATHTSDALMPDRKMYMELNQSQTPGMQQWNRELFRPGDASDACAEWMKLPSNHGSTCKNLGSETVNGRSTIKFQGTNAEGKTGYAWVDKKIAFPIKWQEENDTWEMRNIKEASQPASLFEIPPGYQKFQMPGHMQGMQPPQ
jgi:hypothetical protein